jgi:hypothetical protein
VTSETLHRSEVSPRIEKMGDECAAQIVGGESLYPSIPCSLPQNVEHRLIRHPTRYHTARLVDRQK